MNIEFLGLPLSTPYKKFVLLLRNKIFDYEDLDPFFINESCLTAFYGTIFGKRARCLVYPEFGLPNINSIEVEYECESFEIAQKVFTSIKVYFSKKYQEGESENEYIFEDGEIDVSVDEDNHNIVYINYYYEPKDFLAGL